MNTSLFLVNPIAGSGNGRKFFEKHLKNHPLKSHFDVLLTDDRGHATEICSQYSKNYKNIIICGGDGTLNEALNGLSNLDSVNLGIIPVGSGNDFALNISPISDFDRYIESVVKSEFKLKNIDIGIIEYYNSNLNKSYSRIFINSCGIGFDAYVACLNQNTKKIKGRLSYIYSILVGLIKSKPISISGVFDDERKEAEYLLIAVGNGKTAGGGLYLTPGAKIDDNRLDFTFLENTTKFNLVFNLLPKAVLNKIKNAGKVKMSNYISATIKLKNPYFVHVDGESLGGSISSIEFRILHKALNIIEY